MAKNEIVSLIDEEIDRLRTVRRMLEKSEPVVEKLVASKGVKKSAAKKSGAKRVLSPEARKRIADAQKKRWAAQKRK